MDAQGTKGTQKKGRRLADYVFKMADSSMADDYAIIKNDCRPVHFAYLKQKIVCPHPSCEDETVFFKKRSAAALQASTLRSQ